MGFVSQPILLSLAESAEQAEGMIFVDELFLGDGEWERVVKVKDFLTYLAYQIRSWMCYNVLPCSFNSRPVIKAKNNEG